jgi:phosphate starvation-inducible membrane PsiE
MSVILISSMLIYTHSHTLNKMNRLMEFCFVYFCFCLMLLKETRIDGKNPIRYVSCVSIRSIINI